MDILSPGVTTNELAAMLRVSRRSIERAIMDGRLVASFSTPSGSVRFTLARAEELKARADEARSKGHKQVLAVALASGPILRPRQKPQEQISALDWLRRKAWKLAMRRRPSRT